MEKRGRKEERKEGRLTFLFLTARMNNTVCTGADWKKKLCGCVNYRKNKCCVEEEEEAEEEEEPEENLRYTWFPHTTCLLRREGIRVRSGRDDDDGKKRLWSGRDSEEGVAGREGAIEILFVDTDLRHTQDERERGGEGEKFTHPLNWVPWLNPVLESEIGERTKVRGKKVKSAEVLVPSKCLQVANSFHYNKSEEGEEEIFISACLSEHQTFLESFLLLLLPPPPSIHSMKDPWLHGLSGSEEGGRGRKRRTPADQTSSQQTREEGGGGEGGMWQ